MLARSAFEHSANYDSVVLLGRFRALSTEEQKLEALQAFMKIRLPGRWSEVRAPTGQELKATAVLALPICDASVKTRSGPPDDDESPDAARDVGRGDPHCHRLRPAATFAWPSPGNQHLAERRAAHRAG